MRLKLDLHLIYNDSRAIEEALGRIIEEAVDKRAAEVEIIPGKGSGALKKTVIRFLDRPNVKARYHRLEKDSDNWGRLFIHFRHSNVPERTDRKSPRISADFRCFCCAETVQVLVDPEEFVMAFPPSRIEECPVCGSPNRISGRMARSGELRLTAANGYDGTENGYV